jgi:hypothetical protein
LEQGRFGRQQNLQALIENWSLKIGHWQLNSAFPAAQWPFRNFQWPSRWRFQSAGSIMFDPRLEYPAAVSRSQAPGNPFREVRKMSKNRRVSAAQVPYYHSVVGLQDLFFHKFTADHGSGTEDAVLGGGRRGAPTLPRSDSGPN